MIIDIDQNIRLELMAAKHAYPLFNAVNNNKEHLSEFLPWVENMRTPDDFLEYIESCEILYQQKKEVSFVILVDEKPSGRIGLHHMNMQNKYAAIGYWFTKDAEGRGIVTRSCEALIHYGFNDLELNRIEIKAAVENLRSQAIARKLGFKQEGILRQAELVNSKYLDLVLFSLLKEKWIETVIKKPVL